MREMLNSLHAKLIVLELDRKTHPQQDINKLSKDHLKKIQDREYFTKMKILNKKFSKSLLDAVLNISKKELTEDETRVLARGFKFRPTPNLPIKDVIIGTEALIKTTKVAPEIANHMRSRIVKELNRMQDLEKRRPTKPNMSPKEWVAVNNLKKDKETIIIPVDKGDKSIVMDYLTEEAEPNKDEDTSVIVENESYLSKLEDRIQEHTKIDEDPAKKHEKALNAA